MNGFQSGDRVRWIGPRDDTVGDGEIGWLLDFDDEVGEHIVAWDEAGTEVVTDLSMLEKVGDRNEPNPEKRLPGDPFAPGLE